MANATKDEGTKPETLKTRSGVPFSLDEIRVILSDEIAKVRDGESSPARANAVTNATGKILSSVKLEMEYFRLIGRTPNIPMLAGESESKS